MTTGIIFAEGEQHTQKGHPEHAGRLAAVRALLTERGMLARLTPLEAQPATDADLLRVHSAEQIELVRWISERGGGMIGGDTYTTSGTLDAATLAAGTAIRAVEGVMSGEVDNAIALVRPPGHHAGASSIEGFCLFNNIAVAARFAQERFGVERVTIIDFDVHHGNGTQDIFYSDDSVQFFSIHMFGHYFYPGSGRAAEDGTAAGVGYTINAALPPGTGDRGYREVFDGVVEPLIEQFEPQLLLVSAGFDAHWRDPLAQMELSLTGYADIVQRTVSYAEKLCDGNIVFVLEGGYDLEVLGLGVVNLANALLGDSAVLDPIGTSPNRERDISDVLIKLKQRHLLA